MTQKIKFKELGLAPLVISAVFFLAALSVFYFFLGATRANNRQADSAKLEWLKLTAEKKEAESLSVMLISLLKDREELDKHFITGTNIVPLLDMIEKTAGQTGAEAEVTQVETPKGKNFLEIKVTARGQFESIYKLLLLLESSPFELSISGAEIKKENGGEASDWSARFIIRLSGFYSE